MTRRQASYGEAADMLAELSTAVRVTRRARRLDLRQTAEKSGVSFTTIGRIERGEDCSLSNAIKLLRWLDGTS
ncbi:MAG TPA: helix-turn-helix transcriptional regulator [Jiangellaceae bacterium]|nr:helix-turn-helix transcriptional regulator [Jiangellaceae bacterium]